jgi:uncharacterized coiled-coil protein SlyX
MKKQHDYCDRVLLKLRRKYHKDEVVAALNKALSQREIEVGKLKAEIDYLTSKLEGSEKLKPSRQRAMDEAKKEELYQKLEEEKNSYKSQLANSKANNSELVTKLLAFESIIKKVA